MQTNKNTKSKKLLSSLLLVIITILIVSCPLLQITSELFSIENLTDTALAVVGDILEAKGIRPIVATYHYQWQRATDEEGQFTDIEGEMSSKYTTIEADIDHFIRVGAIGTGNYSNAVYSQPVRVLSTALPITHSIIEGVDAPVLGAEPVASITETSQFIGIVEWEPEDEVFKSNTVYTVTITLSPKSGYTSDSVEENFFTVDDATTSNELGSPLVTAVFAATGKTPLVSIGPITGIAKVGEIVGVGSLSPSGATASYQWQASNGEEAESYTNILGETNTTLTIDSPLATKNIRVVATGTGNFSGNVTSAPKGPVLAAELISIGDISGSAQVGNILTVGQINPVDAIVDYWWQSSETIDGTYTDIEMGNEETYTLQATDVDKFIRVEAEAAASQLAYTGSVFSVSIGPVLSAPLESIGAITDHPRVESTLEIGNITPLDATVDIQWQISDTKNGTYDAIPDAEGTNYVVKDTDKLKYIRIQATGNGGYQGVLTSESVQIGYEVGDIGPLGGTIIMDKGVYDKSVGFCTTGYNFRSDTTVTEAWRYLELAPKGWFSSGSDPTTKWDTTPIDSASRPSYGLTEVGNTLALVGEGKESTDAILEELGAQAAAATQVRSYGTQWYLPTVSELKLVYSALTADERVAAGLATSGYTTSSEISYTQTWLVDMGDGGQFYTGWHKWDEFYVRPMRRF